MSMEFNEAAGVNPADRQSVLGKPIQRVDGPLKVSGLAPYAYERHDVAAGQLVGYPLAAQIARGRIVSMDTGSAEAAPGVASVLTTLDIDALPVDENNVARLFGGAEIAHYHQAIAVVVAETFEQARAAAALIRVEYAEEEGKFDLAKAEPEDAEPTSSVGDFEAAFARAEVTLEETYTTPGQSHAMMEPHASIAHWESGRLTLWTSNQMVDWCRNGLANTLGIPAQDIRVEAPYIGGGFGAKLFLRADAVLAALAARRVGRPVKVALPRTMVMNNTTHRSATIQRIRIGASRDGRISAIAHESLSNTLAGGTGEDATDQTRRFYAAPNRMTVHRLAELDLPEANAMRAPGEASGLMGLEVAMDEMAEKLGLDPVEFRILNDTQVDPEKPERPFSDRNFVECLREGARAFGWDQRNRSPGSQRHGAWLMGQGMAAGYRAAPVMPSAARLRLHAGQLTVETDMTDIGTGSYTILAQTAAELLGLGISDVEVRLGNSAFPVSAGSGGQWGAASATAGVYAAAMLMRQEIARRLGNADAGTLIFEDGHIVQGGVRTPLTAVSSDEIVVEETASYGKFRRKHVVATFAAHFVEVAVHAASAEIRLRRMLAACDAGRIMNPMTARSQVIGGMVMGAGSALMEEISVDTGRGYFVNHDLAGYEVPVHADIPDQQVIFLNTEDAVSGPLKGKGVGELGLCGVAPAIANAVYNATGVRFRDYPLTPARLVGRLP